MSNLSVLTTDSVSRLRKKADRDPIGFLTSSNPLESIEELSTFESEIQYRSVTLTDAKATADTKNALKIFEALPGLTPALAADERVWVTLTLGEFWNYSRKRWPIDSARARSGGSVAVGIVGDDTGSEESTSSIANSIAQMKSEHNWLTNHFFAAGTRARIRDNAIARLWWLARYASQIPGVSQAEGLNLLIGLDQDIASTILGRPSIAAAPNLMEAIFSAVSSDPGFLTMKSSERRYRFRNFMKDIDLIAGRRVLSFLPVGDLEPEITALYQARMKVTT
jgi:hypothetical protein